MSKHEKLLNFYLSLQDEAKLKRYQDDLEGLLAEADLSDEEKGLVRRGDEKEVHRAIGDERAAAYRWVAPPIATQKK